MGVGGEGVSAKRRRRYRRTRAHGALSAKTRMTNIHGNCIYRTINKQFTAPSAITDGCTVVLGFTTSHDNYNNIDIGNSSAFARSFYRYNIITHTCRRQYYANSIIINNIYFETVLSLSDTGESDWRWFSTFRFFSVPLINQLFLLE